MDVTLTQALVQIFGRGVAAALAPDQLGSNATSVVETPDMPVAETTPGPPVQMSATLAALAAEAKTHYDNAERAQRAGDWALYGEEMNKLQAVIEDMQKTP